MKIIGIGNAIVDVICKVDNDFLSHNNLTKGLMKLIFDQNEYTISNKIKKGREPSVVPLGADLDQSRANGHTTRSLVADYGRIMNR